jgi:iron complex outermembrane recepter protein
MLKSKLAFVSFATLATALATPAIAQEAQGDENQGGIREIVVTAQKREENIQTVPIAVTAIDEQALAQSSVKDVRDLAGRVPGLVVDSISAGPRGAGIALRGISFEDIEKSFDPAVGVVVDGVFIGTNTGQLLDVFDLESIEVLRGPQGTLFGRNTIAGVINVRRAKPTGELGAKGSFGIADFGTYRGRASIDTPEIGGVLSLKGFAYWDKLGGYYRNVTQNRRTFGYETLTFGASALIKPTDAISLNVTYERLRERGETDYASLSATPNLAFGSTNDLICLRVPAGPGVFVRAFRIPDAQCDRERLGNDGLYTTFGNRRSPVKNDGDNIYANLDVDLGGFKLVGVTGYQTNKEDVFLDFDAASVNFFDVRRRQTYKQLSQELRLVGDVTDGINLLVGGYFFDSSYVLRQNTNLGFTNPPASTFIQTRGDSESYAIFGDAKIKLADRLNLGVGGRYSWDKKAFRTNLGITADGSCPTTIPDVNANTCAPRESFGKFTWRASANYEIGDRKLVYASYATGYRSGGFNGRQAAPERPAGVTTGPLVILPYLPETVRSVEVGLKADWLDRTLRTNIALFTTKYNNKQEETVEPTPAGVFFGTGQQTVVRNAASAKISGVEIELTAAPTDGLTFTAGLAYTDAKYKNFVRGGIDVSDLDLRRAPKYTWSVGMDYSREIGSGTFGLSTNFRYLDEYSTCISNDPIALRAGRVQNDRRCTSSTREALDATLSYAIAMGDGEVKLSVFGRNLLDDRGISSTLPVAGLFTFAGARPPRQLGGEVSFKF